MPYVYCLDPICPAGAACYPLSLSLSVSFFRQGYGEEEFPLLSLSLSLFQAFALNPKTPLPSTTLFQWHPKPGRPPSAHRMHP